MGTTLCPCGEEPLDRCHGFHVIGVSCRERVVKHVRRRFGPHRYAGRYAADVEDIVQDCFRKLLASGGLDSFEPDPERKRTDAFRAWLWRLVSRHCNNWLAYFRRHPEVGGEPIDNLPEPYFETLTSEQEFCRARLREVNERAVEAVERRWRAKGSKGGQRFDVLLPLVYEEESDTQRARERLGVSDNHLSQLKRRLALDLRRHVREQILEDLLLEPASDPADIERAIDREIGILFQAAYPRGRIWAVLSKEPDPDPKLELEPAAEHASEQSEVTP